MGKALVIDGHFQERKLDEYIYHESLVHPALRPKTVFIMGGGGSGSREAQKHKGLEKIKICDIDRTKLPEFLRASRFQHGAPLSGIQELISIFPPARELGPPITDSRSPHARNANPHPFIEATFFRTFPTHPSISLFHICP
ncbi:hypothetical protein VNO78_03320 [Psophocarpus tetragonolobus]|uniref:PABS domain-containing protein n=1 Tax=Psophocarpus tetragonolobus TaxID=3891 RepID=A0AAN9T448_PSOTE